jgi:N-acetylglucosaminyl-diphospho-decaprenol L-rhamnosyltransferase
MADAIPELAVLIVNWKVHELLRACLSSVKAGTAHTNVEIIVVDNDSRDGSVAMLAREFPSVRAIANARNVGFGAANNQAFARSRAPYVLLLNPDTRVMDGALERMLTMMKASPRVGAIGCRLLNGDGSLQKWTGGAFPSLAKVARHYLFLDRLFPGVVGSPLYLDRDVDADLEVDWVSGACMLLRREALGARIFDEAYFLYGEDMDLCHRLRQAGWRVIYTPAVSILHYQGASLKQQQGDILLSSLKGPRQFYRLTHGGRRLWLFDALTVAGFALRWLLYGASSMWTGKPRSREKAASSRAYLGLAWRLMKAAK